jgi:hypothetical protein
MLHQRPHVTVYFYVRHGKRAVIQRENESERKVMVVCKAYFQNVPRMRNEKREERREKREERREKREEREERRKKKEKKEKKTFE